MAFPIHMASSVGRGLARVGRRCRAPIPVARPLTQQGLDLRHSTTSLAKACASSSSSSTAAASKTPRGVIAWGLGTTSQRTAVISLPRRRHSSLKGALSRPFSTSTTDSSTPSTAETGAKAVVERKGKQGANGAAKEAASFLSSEENPLKGVGADDGDPGPPPPLDPSIVTGPSPKVLKVMEGIDSLNFMELAMLIEVFKNKLGLDEIPSLNFGSSAGFDDGSDEGEKAKPAAEVKTLFNVKVTGYGEKAKIKVIKEVRSITGLGLREAKEVVETLPQVVKEDLKEKDAEAMKVALEAVGATVELE